jgi:type VI secretion system protein ImpK
VQSNATARSDTFLLTQFREFYREVLRLRQMAEGGTLRFHVRSGSDEAPSAVSMVNKIWQELAIKIEQQNAVAQRGGAGNFSASTYREALYVMAAIADETFVYLDWDGRDLWREKLLESYHFGSHYAGDEIFTKIDSLLDTREQASVELAAVYFSALSLGFQGKHRGSDEGSATLKDYKDKLYAYIFRRDPQLSEDDRLIFPESYEQTITRGTGKRLSNPRRWWLISAAVVAVFLLISYVLWRDIARQIEPVVRDIIPF